MKKIVFGLLFYIFPIIGFCQSIPSYWMNIYGLDELYMTRSNSVKQMIVDVTGYYSSGSTYKEKWIFNYMDSNKIMGQKFENEQLSSSFEYEFDNLGNIVLSKIDSKIPSIGWQTLISQKEYRNGQLRIEKHLTSEKQLKEYIQFDYDDLGKPIKMSIYNSLGQLVSYETAEYNNEKLVYRYKIFNSYGDIVSDQLNNCNPDTTSNIKNVYNDYTQIRWPSANPNILHHLEYEYDNFGNWTKRKWMISEGKKQRKRSIITRKIIYSNTN